MSGVGIPYPKIRHQQVAQDSFGFSKILVMGTILLAWDAKHFLVDKCFSFLSYVIFSIFSPRVNTIATHEGPILIVLIDKGKDINRIGGDGHNKAPQTQIQTKVIHTTQQPRDKQCSTQTQTKMHSTMKHTHSECAQDQRPLNCGTHVQTTNPK